MALQIRHIPDSAIGSTVEVRELNWGQLSGILAKASDMSGMAVQNELLAASVYVDGAALGLEALNELPGSEVMRLLPIVQELNPLGADESGEDSATGN